MTDAELKSQRNKAKAALELAQMQHRGGLLTPADVEQTRQRYQELMNYRLMPEPTPTSQPPATAPPPPRDEPAVELPRMPVSEFTRLLEELTLEKARYHKEMAIRCNRLKDVPDDESAKDLVDEIDHYYDARTAVAVKINYLKANGQLPQDGGNEAVTSEEDHKLAYMANLPADKYELAKKLNLVRSNLSKARGRLERAKDPVTKQHYAQKVARLDVEVALILSRLSAAS